MQPRHTAALALVGWYLMIPPMRGQEILDHSPLSKWQVGEEDDSKVECENTIEDYTKNAEQVTDPGTVAEYTRGRCMASDDPRLKDNADVKKTKQYPAGETR
jgi:hypothetical protein